MKRTIICLAIMAVLAGGLYFFFSKDNSNVFEQTTGAKEATEECIQNGSGWYVERTRTEGGWEYTCERFEFN